MASNLLSAAAVTVASIAAIKLLTRFVRAHGSASNSRRKSSPKETKNVKRNIGAFICATCKEEFVSRNRLFEDSASRTRIPGDTSDLAKNSTRFRFDTRENKLLEAYYSSQKICPRDRWKQALRIFKSRSLPISFYVSGRANRYGALALSNLTARPGTTLRQLGLTERSSFQILEKSQHTTATLGSSQFAGAMFRIETVSMIPPLLLDPKPEDLVCDMCCAPGGKTLILLDLMHRGLKPGEIPSGFLVANDESLSEVAKNNNNNNNNNNKRRHQTKNAIQHSMIAGDAGEVCGAGSDARYLPSLRKAFSGYKFKFDKILCDVPCSGDGTLRKGQIVWKKWRLREGLTIHSLQKRILLRGLQLLRPNGVLCYSTCSLNPLENEAAIERLGGSSEDSYDAAPSGAPSSHSGEISGGDDKKENKRRRKKKKTKGKKRRLPPFTLFPPSAETISCGASTGSSDGDLSAREAKKIRSLLPLCARFLPDETPSEDTGGFFVALLKRTGDCF
eukprot:jgi/Bigna1/75092/fgenesh1_pg.32_\